MAAAHVGNREPSMGLCHGSPETQPLWTGSDGLKHLLGCQVCDPIPPLSPIAGIPSLPPYFFYLFYFRLIYFLLFSLFCFCLLFNQTS